MRSLIMFFVFILVAFSAAAIGAQFSPGSWYMALAKPPWTPPNWLFAPVWSALYFMIAISGWLVWQRIGFSRAVMAMAVYLLQLVLNGAWSWIFFGLQNPQLAFIEIVVLWSAILVTVLLFWRVRPAAGALLLPYLAWVGFAAVLNWKLWQLNG